VRPICRRVQPQCHRRHLTPEQKREIIRKLLKASQEKSDRQVAKLAGVSHPHVGKVRRSLQQTGDVETVSTSTDKSDARACVMARGKALRVEIAG
jgi:hypothetical protein